MLLKNDQIELNGPPTRLNVYPTLLNDAPRSLNGDATQLNGAPTSLNDNARSLNDDSTQLNDAPRSLNDNATQLNDDSTLLNASPTWLFVTFPKITWQDLYYFLEENTNMDLIPYLYSWCFNLPAYFFLQCYNPVYWNRFGCNSWMVLSHWLIFLFLHTALILNAGFPFPIFVMHCKIRQCISDVIVWFSGAMAWCPETDWIEILIGNRVIPNLWSIGVPEDYKRAPKQECFVRLVCTLICIVIAFQWREKDSKPRYR